MRNLFTITKKNLSLSTLIFIFSAFLVTSSCASSVTLEHKSDLNKAYVKCREWHQEVLGRTFNYKNAFCYQWREEEEGKLLNKKMVWKVRVYDVAEYHEMFVQMGVIGKLDLIQ